MIKLHHRVVNNGFLVAIDKESVNNFQALVYRATNLWPDAPAEIKEFADAVTNFEWHSGPLQDYRSQDTSPAEASRKKEIKVLKSVLIRLGA